jgi:biopolymer transport protein ExbD
MKIKRKRRPSFLESTASSDIAFLLIIYFLVIAGFNVDRGFLMTLPQKNSTRLVMKDKLLRFELDAGGQILYAGKTVSRNWTRDQIALAVRERPDLAVVVTVNPEAPWQSVVSFVELAQALKVDAFSFSMENPPPTGGGSKSVQ